MQIQKIQNNNNYNTHFGAKVQLRGAVKDLPKELIKEFEFVAQFIGKDADIVNIDIGRKYQKTITWSEMGHRCESTEYYRSHNIGSYVNGKSKQHRIVSYAIGEEVNDIKSLREHIIEYLIKLVLAK